MAKKHPERRILLWSGEIGRLLLGFMVITVLAHATPPDVLGVYLSITSILLIVPRLLDCGLPHAFGYFLRKAPGSLRSSSKIITKHIVLAAPVALLMAFCIRFVPFANVEAATVVQSHWLQMGLYIVSELLILLGLSTFIPTARFKAYVAAVMTPPSLQLICVVLWPKADLTAVRLLELLLGSSSFGSFVTLLMLARGARQGTHDGGGSSSETYAYGIRAYAASVSKIAAQRFDRLFLVTVLGAAGYAQYSLAISIRDMAILPANLYATTLRNRQIDLIARKSNVAEARVVLCKISGTWLALGVAGALVMYTFWHDLVPLVFGQKLRGAAGFIRTLAFSCAPLAVTGFAWNHLYALGMPGRVTWLTTVSLLAALPVFALFIHIFGAANGVAVAAVAWSIGAAVASFICAWVSRPHESAVVLS